MATVTATRRSHQEDGVSEEMERAIKAQII